MGLGTGRAAAGWLQRAHGSLWPTAACGSGPIGAVTYFAIEAATQILGVLVQCGLLYRAHVRTAAMRTAAMRT
jgi:hypothetical protein